MDLRKFGLTDRESELIRDFYLFPINFSYKYDRLNSRNLRIVQGFEGEQQGEIRQQSEFQSDLKWP